VNGFAKGNETTTSSTSSPQEPKLDILRVKGVIKPTDRPAGTKVVIQGVQELYDIKEAVSSPAAAQEDLENAGKVVFIGRGLDNQLLLSSCLQFMRLGREDVTVV
jgi:G3E family GTPase